MNSLIRIASRKSDLARLQAKHVASLLQRQWPDLKVEFHFSESLGDKNLLDPLWKMPEKGVFTSDLSEGLSNHLYDLVVHSWKDLPLESDSQVLGAPKREDPRDLILFKKDQIPYWQQKQSLTVLSSSPRRAYNLEPFLIEYLPKAPHEIRFEPVRGNIPTRIQKLVAGDSGAHALVVAKAALDRLLSCTFQEFEPVRGQLNELLKHCEWLVAPLSLNPPAPAQGALALEARTGDLRVKSLVEPILCDPSTQEVRLERLELGRFGGGCHQKIGSSYQTVYWGTVHTLRGESSSGKKLRTRELIQEKSQEGSLVAPPHSHPAQYWSTSLAGLVLFDREWISSALEAILDNPYSAKAHYYVSHPDALPDRITPQSFRFGPPTLWCSGRMTWRALTGRGFWVRGCDDSLGEQLPQGFTKLGHADSPELGEGIATYRLIPRAIQNPAREWDLKGKTHFFWRSISQFERVSQSYPEVLQGHHACGLGSTARWLKTRVKHLEICLDEADWRRRHGIEKLS